MSRTRGSRNRDYEQARTGLVRALVPHLVDGTGRPSTLKALADAAGVSVPTLKHYFGDWSGVVRAVLACTRDANRVHLDRMPWRPDRTPSKSW